MVNKNFINKVFLHKVFKFIFFIRYLLIIFLISSIAFLSIPSFFNFEKEFKSINKQLDANYKIIMSNYDQISYKIFPSPRIIVKNSKLSINKNQFELLNGDLTFKLNLKDIYQIKNLSIKNIFLDGYNINLNTANIKNILNYISNQKNKITLLNTNIKIQSNKKTLLNFKNFTADNKNLNKINFSTYYFEKKILGTFSTRKDSNILNLSIKNLGINTNFKFFANSNLNESNGKAKIKILENKIKFDFKVNNQIELSNSNFRNKNLVNSFDGIIRIKPFLNFDLIFDIKKIDKKIFKINFNKILNKQYIKKINGKFVLVHSRKNRFNNKEIFEKILIKLDLQNGNITFDESFIKLKDGSINFNGNVFDFENAKKIDFDLNAKFEDISYFLKYFSLSEIKIDRASKFKIYGSYYLVSNRIMLKEIVINSKKLKKEDLNFVEESFEKILIKENILNIFNKKKLQSFFSEIK